MNTDDRARNIVVIGGVAAGMKSAAKVRRGDPKAKITVIERGEIVSYGACGMPYIVEKIVPSIDHLMMTPSGSIRNASFFKATKNKVIICLHDLTSDLLLFITA